MVKASLFIGGKIPMSDKGSNARMIEGVVGMAERESVNPH